jgi:diacylglycerol kinase (ATP)
MRIHLIAAMLVGLVGSGIRLGLAEKVTLIFCVLLVFFAETLNSALEQLVDLAIQQFDEKARLTKDAAAAGVLVLAIGTVVIFSAIVVHNWETIATHQGQVFRQTALGIPMAALMAGVVLNAKKPFWLETAFFLGALGLWSALLVHSESYVFSVLILGLIVLSGAAALQRKIKRV